MEDGNVTPIRGLDRQGIWVVENKYPAAENENTIGLLTTHSQVQYAAPLFSSNGETAVIIPEIVIRVKPGMQIEQVQTVCQTAGCTIKKRMEFTGQEYLLEVLGPDADAVFDGVEELNGISFVEWACPNTASRPRFAGRSISTGDRVHAQDSAQGAAGASTISGVFPDDEYFPMQWHLYNTGQSGGTPGADIRAPEAWEITTGDPNIIVAVVDSGVDTNHPDLINNIVPGYDFRENDDSPDPALDHWYNAHGTESAGLIAAHGNNTLGVSGVAWNCKIMPIRNFRAESLEKLDFITEADHASAFRWAAANGADILSNSWGWRKTPTPIIHSAIKDITGTGGMGRAGKGCVVLFAGGNQDEPIGDYYPRCYPEVIAVGATDHNDLRCSYSNFGPELDIVAPSAWQSTDEDWVISNGRGALWTTDISGMTGCSEWHGLVGIDPEMLDYTLFDGTSGATPVAAGVAALILSVEPNLTNKEVRHFLERSAKDLGDPGWDEYYGHGRVDARAAVELAMAARADLNDDYRVDLRDFAKLAQYWMQDEASVDIYPPPRGDGVIDAWDVVTMGEYWLREIPNVHPVAHWKLDEADGDVAYDSAGDNHATVHNGEWTEGKIDGALVFNGWTTYLDCGDSEVLSPEQMTLAMWLWPEHMGGMRYVLSRANEDTDVMDYMLTRQRTGELEFVVGQLGSDPAAVMTTAQTPLGEWSHVALSLDGSQALVYINGQLDASADYGQRVAREDLRLVISSYQANTRFYNGKIDDVRIHDTALSAEDIRALYGQASD
jgi:subtilisin family serine protease